MVCYAGGAPMLRPLTQDRVFTPLVVGGVPIRLQTSAFLLPLCAAMGELIMGGSGWRGAAFTLLFILLLHACGLLHELGHILPARAVGATVTQIRLSGMGIFVQIRNLSPSRSSRELLIALSGPLVSALLACGLSIAAWSLSGMSILAINKESAFLPLTWKTAIDMVAHRDAKAMLMLLAICNALLTLFNLLPAFPMDGGRALSALLALFLPPRQATMVVASFGQIMAIGAVPAAALLTQSWLLAVLILPTASFVFWVSFQERRSRGSNPAQ